MGAVLLTYEAALVPTACGVCGIAFAVPKALFAYQRRLGPKAEFYCPAGHRLCFPGETEAERLARELKLAIESRERAEALARQRGLANDQLYKTKRQLQGKMKALKTRVKNGVCPCCNRSFVQLARHMATKHPDYNAPEPEAE